MGGMQRTDATMTDWGIAIGCSSSVPSAGFVKTYIRTDHKEHWLRLDVAPGDGAQRAVVEAQQQRAVRVHILRDACEGSVILGDGDAAAQRREPRTPCHA